MRTNTLRIQRSNGRMLRHHEVVTREPPGSSNAWPAAGDIGRCSFSVMTTMARPEPAGQSPYLLWAAVGGKPQMLVPWRRSIYSRSARRDRRTRRRTGVAPLSRSLWRTPHLPLPSANSAVPGTVPRGRVGAEAPRPGAIALTRTRIAGSICRPRQMARKCRHSEERKGPE